MLVKPIQAQKDVAKGLIHVVDRLEWYMALCSLVLRHNWNSDAQFLSFAELTKTRILQLYSSILRYEMEAVCEFHHTHAAIRGIKDILGMNDWKGGLEAIMSLEAAVYRDIEQYNTQSSVNHLNAIATSTGKLQEISDALSRIVEEQQRLAKLREQGEKREQLRSQAELIGRFKTTAYDMIMKVNPMRVPGTCEWFISHAKFKDWLDRHSSSILLVSADPGCGKSVLARFLVETVLPGRAPAEALLCYFFFKETPAEHRRISNAICALLHCLFSQRPEIAERCRENILQAGDALTGHKSTSHWTTLWDIFLKACGMLEKGIPVICVLDALDECDPGEARHLTGLVKKLFERQGEEHPTIKFLVTTRGYPHILQQFGAFSSSYIWLSGESKAEVDQIQGEIDLVVKYRLKELSSQKQLSEQQGGLIAAALERKSSDQRTYLWVKLIFDVLERNFDTSERGWLSSIENLPDTVAEAYSSLLSRVSPKRKDHVWALLHMMVAAYYPLSLREMNIAVHVRELMKEDVGKTPAKPLHDEDDLGLMSDGDYRKWIIDTCGFFVTEYDGCLYLIHQTAKEFLMADAVEHDGPNDVPGSAKAGETWKSSVSECGAHAIIAEACVAYLSLSQFGTETFRDEVALYFGRQRDRDFVNDLRAFWSPRDFLRYATSFLLSHFYECQAFRQDDGQIGTFAGDYISKPFWKPYLALFDSSIGRDLNKTWIRVAIEVNYDLEKSIYFEDTGLVECLPRSGRDSSRLRWSFGKGSTLAMVAATFGHYKLLRHIVEKEREEREPSRTAEMEVDGKLEADVPSSLLSGAVSWLTQRLGSPFNDPGPGGSPGVEVAAWTPDPGPLICAAANGHYECVQYLLDWGYRADCQNQLSYSPLHLAARQGWNDVVELLLDRGADVNAKTKDGTTPLHESIWGADMFDELPRLLVARGAAVDLAKTNGQTALHLAAKYHLYSKALAQSGSLGTRKFDRFAPRAQEEFRASLVKFLIDKGCPIEATGKLGGDNTALHEAVMWSQLPSVYFLLQAGAKVDVPNAAGQTPLHIACYWGKSEIIELLLCSGADTQARDNDDFTPLVIAYDRDDEDTMGILVKHGADLLFPLSKGGTLLHLAAIEGKVAMAKHMVELLLNKGVVSGSNEGGRSSTDQETVQTGPCLSLTSIVDAENIDRRTPLHTAAQSGSTEIAALLAGRGGADLEKQDRDGRTPLHQAALDGQVSVAHVLVAHGASVAAMDAAGQTPLHLASREAVVRLLLDRWQQQLQQQAAHEPAAALDYIDARDAQGRTAFHVACAAANVSVARALRSAGADPALRAERGRTALHLACDDGPSLEAGEARPGDAAARSACENAKREVVELLLGQERGKLDPEALDDDGDAPIEVALRAGFTEVAATLEMELMRRRSWHKPALIEL
jgi:ankyrin repeat protein